MATVPVEDQIKIPGNVATLTAFRHWSLSESFPKRGRIDWVGSRIEVDRSPEDLFTHGTLKTAIVASLWPLARRKGYNLFTGETRISSIVGNLSTEPDVVAVSDAAIDTDRVKLTPKAGGEADRFVELEGGPELVVEIVSDAALTARGCRSPVSDARHRSPGTGGLGDGLRRGEKIALAGREWRFEEPPPDAQAAPPG